MSRSLKEPVFIRSIEDRAHSAKQEQPAVSVARQQARELPRRQQPPRAAASKGKTAPTAAQKGKGIVMPTTSQGSKKKRTATEADNGVPTKLAVLPKFRRELCKHEKEEDFMLMTGGKLPSRPMKHPKTVDQNKLKLITPGAYLSELTMGRYVVRNRKSKKEKHRKTGLKGMMDEGSSGSD